MSHSVGTSVGTGKGSTRQDLVYQPLQNDSYTLQELSKRQIREDGSKEEKGKKNNC